MRYWPRIGLGSSRATTSIPRTSSTSLSRRFGFVPSHASTVSTALRTPNRTDDCHRQCLGMTMMTTDRPRRVPAMAAMMNSLAVAQLRAIQRVNLRTHAARPSARRRRALPRSHEQAYVTIASCDGCPVFTFCEDSTTMRLCVTKVTYALYPPTICLSEQTCRSAVGGHSAVYSVSERNRAMDKSQRHSNISRRNFLITAGIGATGLGLAACGQTSSAASHTEEMAATPATRPLDVPNVAYDPALVPPPITRTEPTTVEFTLTAKEVTAELADGTSFTFWTFDGTVPGPMLRVMEGDTVKVTLVNPKESSAPHNIDFHAATGPGGGAAVTNAAPGETKTFSFKALRRGIYIYHCAAAPAWHHVAMGMYGAMLVEPPGGLPRVDREFYVVQGEWYTTGAFGAKGHQGMSNEKAMAERPEYFTMNGHTAALTELYPLKAKVGETVRLFFGVGGPNIGSNFHVIGEIFEKVYSGSPDTFTANEETWYTPPGSATVFELKLEVPGKYTLVDHALFRVAKGAAGALLVEGEHDESIFSPMPPAGSSH